MPRVIAYTYDADTHCPTCTAALHGPADGARRSPSDPLLDEHGVPENATDFEGNPVAAIFSTDTWCNEEGYGCTLWCADCGHTLDDHEPSTHGYCDCRDGCDVGDCAACAADEPEDDEDGPGTGCQCVNCTEPETETGCQCDTCTAPDYVPGADELCDPATYFADLATGAPAPAAADGSDEPDDLDDEPFTLAEPVTGGSPSYARVWHSPMSPPHAFLASRGTCDVCGPERCRQCNTPGPVYATGLCAPCASPSCRGLHSADGTLVGDGAWPHTCPPDGAQ